MDVFITALYNLAEKCEYKSLHDEMIRDRTVVGMFIYMFVVYLTLEIDNLAINYYITYIV